MHPSRVLAFGTTFTGAAVSSAANPLDQIAIRNAPSLDDLESVEATALG
jgi:hypothetical protein